MRSRTILLTLACAAVMLGGLAAGCGDGDSEALTLEEYFARFEAIDAKVDEDIDALYTGFPDDVTEEEFFSNEDNFELIKGLFTGFPAIVRSMADDLGDLEPPSEAEDVHNEMLDAANDLLQALESSSIAIDDAATITDLEVINQGIEAEIAPAQQRFDDACLDLVAVAEENDIAVNISCTDEG